MEKFAPSYFNDFVCIKGKCKHNCCIGWEIAIDKRTHGKILRATSPYKDTVLENLTFDGENHIITLCENARCPFLNKDNLCDVIINMGNGYISEICTEHPRFYNRIGNRVEAGLGLACEACAEIILDKGSDFSLIKLSQRGKDAALTPKEQNKLSKRDKIIDIIKSADNFDSAVIEVFSYLGIKNKSIDILAFLEYLSEAEYIEDEWCNAIDFAKRARVCARLSEKDKKALFIYFIYRHYITKVGEREALSSVMFALLSTLAIERISGYYFNEQKPTIEAARLYSANIEYSSENTDTLINLIMINGECNG